MGFLFGFLFGGFFGHTARHMASSSLTMLPAMEVQSLKRWTAREVLDQVVVFTFTFKLIKAKHN